MKVVVLCRKLEGMPANGFDRYSHDLVENLSKLPEVEIILPNQTPSLDIRSYGSVASPLYYDIFLPIATILRGRMRGDVFHAVTDGQAVVFPWLKGKKILTMHHVDKTPPIGVKEKIFRIFYGVFFAKKTFHPSAVDKLDIAYRKRCVYVTHKTSEL